MLASSGTVLCIASYYKGVDFLRAAKANGWKVILITSDSLRDEAWPRESVDEFFYMPGPKDQWDDKVLLQGVDFLATREKIDKIVALDDFDVEKGALLREHLRIPGMGQTRARYFRDKLAMRMMAKDAGIPVPPFTAPFYPQAIHDFTDTVPGPWVLKPRSQASASGIKKVHNAGALWQILDQIGNERINYVLEQFLPGDVYHVDSLLQDGKILFSRASKYMSPPMTVSHDGGIFRSFTLDPKSEEGKALAEINQQVKEAFGMKTGATHTEFIRAHADGRYYFLETSSRVGGANLAEMVEAASGVNLWAEWAKLETLLPGHTYTLPPVKTEYAGIIISLAKQTHPDMSAYNDPDIVWKMDKEYHAGLILKKHSPEAVTTTLDELAQRFYADFYAYHPPADKPTS